MNVPVLATKPSIHGAASILKAGGIVAIPTETVYGLAVDPQNDRAVARLYALKNRPSFNPLIIHIENLECAHGWAILTPLAQDLAKGGWPGPLTLVLKGRMSKSHLALAGLDTVAIRVPANPIAQAVLKAFGGALAAPSANRSETLSPTTADHVFKSFQNGPRPDLVLDGGPCVLGLESTIIDARGENPILLRPGAFSIDQIQTMVGKTVLFPQDFKTPETVRSPGQLRRHYAPRIPMYLNAASVERDQAFLAFGPGPHPKGSYVTMNLSPTGDTHEAAANLFAMLHQLEDSGAASIAIAPIPDVGLGLAINDRLIRGRS